MALRLGSQSAKIAFWEPFMGKMPMLLRNALRRHYKHA